MNYFTDPWDWWRHNHNMPFWSALLMTFKSTVLWPLNEVYSWFWFRTMWRWQLKNLRSKYNLEKGEL